MNSFAIQVKSGREKVQATNKIEYLLNLELPFFIGAVDRDEHRLTMFSGEHLPIAFSHLGRPTELTLPPCETADVAVLGPYDGIPDGPCALRMPFVMNLDSADDSAMFAAKAKELAVLSSQMHANIAARTSKEYIFNLGPARVVIMAGPGSAETVRENFYLWLAWCREPVR